MKRQYITAAEIQQIMGIKQSKAYDIMRTLNDMRKKEGFIVIAGQCPRKYFTDMTGYETDVLDIIQQNDDYYELCIPKEKINNSKCQEELLSVILEYVTDYRCKQSFSTT